MKTARALNEHRDLNERLIRERDQARLRFEELTKEFEKLKEQLKSERELTALASKQAYDALEALRAAKKKSGRFERVLKLVRDVVNLEFPPTTGALMSAAVALAAAGTTFLGLGLGLVGPRS